MREQPDPSAAAAIWSELYESYPALGPCAPAIGQAWELLRAVLHDGHSVLVCGNGGSAADSEHIAAELAKPCARRRPLPTPLTEALRQAGDDGYLAEGLQGGWPVMPLTSQAALLTAIANDQGADFVFAQQVIAYGRPGDLLWALTTSGSSTNVVLALRTARARGMHTMAFTGPQGRLVSGLCDALVELPGATTSSIQQSHLPVYHAFCLAIEAESYAP
jgi:D-sedoheptulose 7-phosphate isomerase